MMVVPYIPGHLSALMLRADSKLGLLSGGEDYANQLFRPGLAYTALGDDGSILGALGVVPLHDGVGDAWGLFAVPPGASRNWVWIDRNVRLFLHRHLGTTFRRIQTVVRSDFEHGHKWVRRLGFSEPRLLDGWGPEGADYDLYRLRK